jgi:hypothetical protein
MYAASLGALLFDSDRDLVQRVYAEQILRRYRGSGQEAYWANEDDIYDQSWAWFGTALLDGGLANLWEGQTTIKWDEVLP